MGCLSHYKQFIPCITRELSLYSHLRGSWFQFMLFAGDVVLLASPDCELQCALELFAARSEAALRSVHEFMRVPEIDCWISADCGGKEEAESPFTISF